MMTCHVIFELLWMTFLLVNPLVTCQNDLSGREKRRSEMLVISPPGKNQEIHKELYFKRDKDDVPLSLFKRDLWNEDDDDENENDQDDSAAFFGGNKRRNPGSTVRTGPKMWDHWTKWSDCSVTCGVGKITRWRHCTAGGCAPGEKEAQIKTCTLPAC